MGVQVLEAGCEAVVGLAIRLERALQGMWGVVPEHLQEKPALHVRDERLVVTQVSHRADRLGQDEQAVCGIAGGPASSERATSSPTTTPLRSSLTIPG